MRRWLALAAVGLMLAVPAVVAGESWTQAGYDASRASYNPVSGPTTDDVAFQVRMPGFISDDFIRAPMGPLIHNGSAYVNVRALENQGAEELGLDLHGIVRVDLDTAEVERFVEVQDEERWRRVAGMGMDSGRLYLSTFNYPGFERLEAYRLSDGEQVWTWEPPDLHGSNDLPGMETWLAGCAQPAVAEGTVYHWCNQQQSANGPDEDPGDKRDAFIVAIDAETGEQRWIWTTQDEAWRTRALQDENPRSTQIDTEFMGFAVVGDFVVAPAVSFRSAGGGAGCYDDILPCSAVWAQDVNGSLIALDRTEGTFAWSHGIELADAGVATPIEQRRLTPDVPGGVSVHPTGDSGAIFVRMLDKVVKLNPHQEENRVLWSEPIGQEDARTAFTLGGFAMDEEAIYTTSTQTVYRMDRDNPSNQWRTSLDPGGDELFLWGGLAVGEDTLYAAAARRGAEGSNGTTLYAMDKATGEVLWRHEIPYDPEVAEYKAWNQNHYHSLADGLLVVGGGDGSLRVIGETPASLVPSLQASTAYPPPDEEVTVDLSGTQPGVHGEATRFKAIWGDGTETGWQSSPVLTHTYAEAGDATARFIVANEAGQTTSTTQTFHVGQQAPTEPNWISERFEPGNQDMTFGVLGIAVAVTGGAIGMTQRYRKRSRLQDELEAIDQAYEATKGRPMECEAQLNERKTYARGLVLNGELDEQQFTVIEKRIEELLQGIRMGAMEDEFDFLPHGLVKRAREMLADGTVTSLEREAFLRAVDEDDVLSEQQKTVVRERIEAWHARDAQGGGS